MKSATIEYKVGQTVPEGLAADVFDNAVIAKPCAWISVDDEKVGLLDGFSVASMAPPILMMAAEAIPGNMFTVMSTTEKKKVTLSTATLREKHCLDRARHVLQFAEMGLEMSRIDDQHPPAVMSSPLQMLCHVDQIVELSHGKQMVLLCIDVIFMKKEILTSPQPVESGERKIVARIDAEKLQPIANMGHNRYATMAGLHLLLRPSKMEDGSSYQSDPFEKSCRSQGGAEDDLLGDLAETIEWKTSEPSPLGFNPIKAIVLPRPIGWIGTYYPESIPHISPYSFFIDVARDSDHPFVAFSAYRPENECLKDAQLDVEEGGCFTVSTVTPDLAVPMNLSSAPIPREESEFALAGIEAVKGDYINAPFVKGAKTVLECNYVKTIEVGAFSVVVGEVVSMKFDESIINLDGKVNGSKLQPVTRLGYIDEYAIIDQCVKVSASSSTLPVREMEIENPVAQAVVATKTVCRCSLAKGLPQ